MTTSCSRLGDCHLCLTVFTVCLRNYKIPQTRSLTGVLHFRVEWAIHKKRGLGPFLKNRSPPGHRKRGMERWFILLRCVFFLYLYVKPVKKLYSESVLILFAGEISVVAVRFVVPVFKPRLEIPHGIERREYKRRGELIKLDAR